MSGERDALKQLTDQYHALFEQKLEEICRKPAEGVPERLHESMAYSLRAGGKRLRPMLCLASAERCGISPERAMPMALALEFIHTASLIHDDLPSMDGDDLRRGNPTNHRVFGEALAVLAGDALLAWAFSHTLNHLPEEGIPPERTLRSVSLLAEAVGPSGICGGQVLDIDLPSQSDSPDFVYKIAYSKTAALIRAAVVTGALLGDVIDADLRCFYDYGTHLGVAFQIVDDILDVTSTKEELGKTPNKDEAQDKRTFIQSYGLDEARKLAVSESHKAIHALEPIFPEGDLLIDLAHSLVGRSH